MADKKQKNPSLITPPLILKWPRLGAPDTKFNKDGEYSTKGLGDPNDATRAGVPEEARQGSG
jgi:hypothetical protein